MDHLYKQILEEIGEDLNRGHIVFFCLGCLVAGWVPEAPIGRVGTCGGDQATAETVVQSEKEFLK